MSKLFQNLRYGSVEGFNARALAAAIEKGYEAKLRGDKVVEKVSFAPSSLAYQSGRCFAAETEFVTDQGVKTLGEMVGKPVRVWTGSGAWNKSGKTQFSNKRGWKSATVQSFGVHPLMKVVLTRNGVEREIFTTAEHRWIVSTTKFSQSESRIRPTVRTTEELEPGHIMWHSGSATQLPRLSPDGIRAGFVHGDGSGETHDRFAPARVKLFGEKDSAMKKYFAEYTMSEERTGPVRNDLPFNDNQTPFVVVSGLPKSYKRLPDLTESSQFLFGWLSGYFAADGNIHSGSAAVITSHNKDSILAVRDVCEILRISHGVVREADVIKLGKVYREYTISINYRELPSEFFLNDSHREYHQEMISHAKQTAARWAVKSVGGTDRVEEVFCVVEPETERFALADGLLTMNCPRRWVMAFQGKHMGKDTFTATSAAVVNQGSGAHSRIQEALMVSGVMKEEEKELINESPPIRGFVDAIVEIEGVEIPVEIKTTRQEAFEWRATSMKPAQYHMYQLLTYMKILDKKHGAFVYENKNDNTLLVIPVEMNSVNQEIIDYAFEWMRTVYKAYTDGMHPARPWKQTSPNCASCPFFDACWAPDAPEGDVRIKPMVVHKW